MEKRFQEHDWKEKRRFRAVELIQKDWSQQEVAEAFGVSKAAVSHWIKALEAGGRAALRARPRPGGPPKLGPDQLALLPDCLSHGAEAYGFRGEIWTCARVALVIEEEFGVHYHKAHVSRLLKQLKWTPQQPVKRASQRNEAQIEQWRNEVWPELKKSASGAQNARLCGRNRLLSPAGHRPDLCALRATAGAARASDQ